MHCWRGQPVSMARAGGHAGRFSNPPEQVADEQQGRDVMSEDNPWPVQIGREGGALLEVAAPERDSNAAALPAPEQVLAFLAAHPDFFLGHVELLETLRVPHPVEGAASLLEFQVRRLQEHNQRLTEQLAELYALAETNQRLGLGIHRLGLHLLEAGDEEAVAVVLLDELPEQFGLPRAALVLAEPPLRLASGLRAWIMHGAGGQSEQALFRNLWQRRRPLAGRLTPAQREWLARHGWPETGSSALIPLLDPELGLKGVLLLGKDDAEGFNPAQDTYFLDQLGALARAALARLYRRERLPPASA